jgi:hypothetical protein
MMYFDWSLVKWHEVLIDLTETNHKILAEYKIGINGINNSYNFRFIACTSLSDLILTCFISIIIIIIIIILFQICTHNTFTSRMKIVNYPH